MLEVSADGSTMLLLSIQLHTGLMIVSPGEVFGASPDGEPVATAAPVSDLCFWHLSWSSLSHNQLQTNRPRWHLLQLWVVKNGHSWQRQNGDGLDHRYPALAEDASGWFLFNEPCKFD